MYDFARRVEQGRFADQAGVNRVLALPLFGAAYHTAQALGYSGRAFPFMVFINRMLAVVCVLLFWKLVGGRAAHAAEADSPPVLSLLPPVLCFAFSYGFWRYANEAETYVLASVFVLGAWNLVLSSSSLVRGQQASVLCPSGSAKATSNKPSSAPRRSPFSVLRPLSFVLCSLVSAIGILVHLLNLIPLLLVIPLYYLLSKEWKKALLHGGLTGMLVVAGYAACAPWLDFSELGAQNHRLEGGLSPANMLRGGIAFGQCLVSGNFLFGFESFRDLLVRLFPSRMLGEEFYMAAHMSAWIKWAGCCGVGALLGIGVCVLYSAFRSINGRPGPRSGQVGDPPTSVRCSPGTVRPRPKALFCACAVWLLLYAVAVVRTEAGSPELWILALIPGWLLAAPWLRGRWAWLLVGAIFAHNLIAGLLPVMAEKTDYHAAKGRWLLENASAEDLILTDYEPVMIFYLDYFTECRILNSGILSASEIVKALEAPAGKVYALASFFQPMESMRVRSPLTYERMRKTGQQLLPGFEKATDDAFGGIYRLRRAVAPVEAGE